MLLQTEQFYIESWRFQKVTLDLIWIALAFIWYCINQNFDP